MKQFVKTSGGFAAILLTVSVTAAYAYVGVFDFSNPNELSTWKEKKHKGKVTYKIEHKDGQDYVAAYSNNAASGLVKEMKFSSKKSPRISWRWQVKKFPRKKSGKKADDYAARVYVIFPSFIFINSKCIEYIWDEKLPAGTVMKSPLSSNIKLFVLESGTSHLNKWVNVERNIYNDYREFFGGKPKKVGGIAIMTDTDNTSSSAIALYDDFKVGY